MSRLAGDLHLHPRTTKRPSGFQSAAAQLLLRHGGKGAANGDSIEFFSALRKCLPDPHVSGQAAGRPADGRGKVGPGGGGGGADELLSSETGKHDYDWLLTPPGTPLWSPATSTSGHQVSAAVPSRLAQTGSPSYPKTNPQLRPTGLEKEISTSRLSKCSSATQHSSVDVAPPSGRLLRVRTSSESSMNTASNASARSTPLLSAASSPRTPGTARSAAATATAHPRHRDKARQATGYAVFQPKASPKYKQYGTPAPTCSRAHRTPGAVSTARSTTAESRLQALARRATAVPRLRLAGTTVGAGSMPQDASPRAPQRPGVASSSNGIKSRPVPAAVKQDGVAVASSTTQWWRQSLAPAIAAARNARRENPFDNGSPRNSAGRKINDEKATPHRTAAAVGSGLTRNGPRKSANASNAKRAVKENEDCRRQDAKHGGAGASAHRKPTLLHETSLSAMPRSRLGLIAANSKPGSGSTAGGRRSTSGSGRHVAALAAAARIAGPDAFPSTRYDAILLREEPKNLTWLRGCDEGDDSLDLVDNSLEPFGVAGGLG